jgi:FkbM family methyltransferase
MSTIPLKIFQTWYTKNISTEMQLCIDDLKSKNTEFEYFLFDDNDCIEFIKNNFDERVLDAYNNLIPGAYKADLWRYCVMYIYGGIYLDIKFNCINDFKLLELTDKEYYVNDLRLHPYGNEPYKGLWNGLIVSKPNNKIMIKCINQIVFNSEHSYYGLGIYDPTGPVLLGSFFTNEEKEKNILKRSYYANINHNGVTMNDRMILNEYKEYRTEKQQSEHYTSAWWARRIYKILSLYSTYETSYGLITLYSNEIYIGSCFNTKHYWNENILLKLKQYINPQKNILEIGGHCGTSSIILSTFLENDNKVYVYEPQKKLYDLIVKNIEQNNLHNKIESYNMGVFCYNGIGNMNDIDLDGNSGAIVSKRYNEEINLLCNFGGLTLGKNGEQIQLTTMDSINNTHDNIGFIYCSAQGSESFIFSNAIDLIIKHRPVIFYYNNKKYGYLFDKIIENYPNYKEEGEFNITEYCIKNLNYNIKSDLFNNNLYQLLIPN